MEKNARICDVCDRLVAKGKCEICDKDICEECADTIMIGLYQGEGDVLFNINACQKCNKQISRVCLSDENIFQEVFKEKPELLKEIIEVIKNVMMLKKVSDEDLDKKEDEEEGLIPIPSPYKNLPHYPRRYPSDIDIYPFKKNPFKYPKNPYYKTYDKLKKKKWWGGTSIK